LASGILVPAGPPGLVRRSMTASPPRHGRDHRAGQVIHTPPLPVNLAHLVYRGTNSSLNPFFPFGPPHLFRRRFDRRDRALRRISGRPANTIMRADGSAFWYFMRYRVPLSTCGYTFCTSSWRVLLTPICRRFSRSLSNWASSNFFVGPPCSPVVEWVN